MPANTHSDMLLSRPRLYALGAGVSLVLVILFSLSLFEKGKAADVNQAPAIALLYANGKLLYENRTGNNGSRPGSYKLRHFGADASPEEIIAYFDSELGKAGYTPVTQTTDSLFTGDPDKMIRQYQNGPYTYRLYLFPLPRKVGPYLYTHEFKHILITKLNN